MNKQKLIRNLMNALTLLNGNFPLLAQADGLALWISTPLIGAGIGWFTNYIAVKMIFRPRKPKNILGFRIQGLLPKRQSELAESVARTVSENLFGREDLQKALADEILLKKIHELLDKKIDDFLTNKLGSIIPMIGAFISSSLVQTVKTALVGQIEKALPELIQSLSDHFDSAVDIHKIVKEKVEGFELSTLEDIINRIAKKELRHIEILGGVLGFLVGLINAAIVAFFM